MRRQIVDSEYEITWQDRTVLADLDAAWQAPNRANGLRTYFTESGIRVVPRSDEPPAWEWSLRLVAWGLTEPRPHAGSEGSNETGSVETGSIGTGSIESETLAAAGQPRVEGTRIEYDRGGIVEWYVNDPRGLEQGFTIAAPPRSREEEGTVADAQKTASFVPHRGGSNSESRSRVRIDLALGGTLDPVISADGQAIDFVTATGVKVIHYAALVVRDGTGRALPARMEGVSAAAPERGIRIVFEDDDAIYPVTVDPLATTPAWTVESNQVDARMGFAVATAGDVNGDGYSDVVVGAWRYDNGQTDEGGAFVYLGSAAGLSTTPAWTGESNQADAEFGWSVATAGDVNGDGYSDVIVGAIQYDNGQTNEGRAFLYRGSAAGLLPLPVWTAECDLGIAWFGASVGTAGDVNGDGYSDVIVGAYGQDRAFVYNGSASGLGTFPSWQSEVGGSEFGISVSTAGDVNGDGYSDIIVGADFYTDGQTQEGLAFAYYGSPAGLPVSPSWFTESDQANARYGWEVSSAGDVNGDGYADVLVGSLAWTNGQTGEGRAYLYQGSASGLSTVASWTVEGNQTSAATGFSLDTAGDVNGDGYADVIVGTAHWANGETSEGRADIYTGSASGLGTSPVWSVESNQTGASLGWSVATAGDVNGDGYSDVIVGAPFYANGESTEGRAFVYLGSASGPAIAAGWSVLGTPRDANAQFSAAVATAGDVNGDGYADVIVGAPLFDGGQTDEGRALLYLGGASGLAVSPSWSDEGNQPDTWFGAAVGTTGDVNGDGYGDVIVGAPAFECGQTNEGRASVYLGGAGGLATTAAWTAESNQANAAFGTSVGTAGDVNGDGYADVLVGAPNFSSGQANEGLVFVYHGSASGLPSTSSSSLERNQAGAAFGTSVAAAGDVDADGYSDVIVGAPLYDNGQTNEGRAFVFRGSVSGLVSNPAWTTESNQADADYGRSVGTAGDVNGDGFSDVIVGAPLFDNGQTDEGRAYVYHGSAGGLATSPAWTAEINQAGARFGASVGTAGDVNGDGVADVIVGADAYTNFQPTEGRAFVYHGSAAGLSTAAVWGAGSNQAASKFGASVGTAGDVNGDGYADVIVGAPLYDNGLTDEGRAFLYYGNGGRGLALGERQRRLGSQGPIARLGASDDSASFRLALTGRSPFGRGDVKLEWEVLGLRSLLDGASTSVASSWTNSGTAGASLNQVVADPTMTAGAPLHWRVRMRYKPSTTPFQPHGRWLTVPWGGWNETMVRTQAAPAGRVPDGTTGTPLRVSKVAGGQIRLDWSASCRPDDEDYEVYEGAIGGSPTSFVPRLCSTSGNLTASFTPSAGNRYYLVVPRNGLREGSYGTTSTGAERPASGAACAPQMLGGCQSFCSGGRFPGAPCSGPQDCPGACTGAHAGQSCVLNNECLGRCQANPQMSCGAGLGCAACNNDPSIRCTTGMDCASVGGTCGSFGPCQMIGGCVNPFPGTCELP